VAPRKRLTLGMGQASSLEGSRDEPPPHRERDSGVPHADEGLFQRRSWFLEVATKPSYNGCH
jgi:hypothetical protein